MNMLANSHQDFLLSAPKLLGGKDNIAKMQMRVCRDLDGSIKVRVRSSGQISAYEFYAAGRKPVYSVHEFSKCGEEVQFLDCLATWDEVVAKWGAKSPDPVPTRSNFFKKIRVPAIILAAREAVRHFMGGFFGSFYAARSETNWEDFRDTRRLLTLRRACLIGELSNAQGFGLRGCGNFVIRDGRVELGRVVRRELQAVEKDLRLLSSVQRRFGAAQQVSNAANRLSVPPFAWQSICGARVMVGAGSSGKGTMTALLRARFHAAQVAAVIEAFHNSLAIMVLDTSSRRVTSLHCRRVSYSMSKVEAARHGAISSRLERRSNAPTDFGASMFVHGLISTAPARIGFVCLEPPVALHRDACGAELAFIDLFRKQQDAASGAIGRPVTPQYGTGGHNDVTKTVLATPISRDAKLNRLFGLDRLSTKAQCSPPCPTGDARQESGWHHRDVSKGTEVCLEGVIA